MGVLLAAAVLFSACHVCQFRSVTVTLPARLDINGQVSSPILSGAVGDGNVAQDSYDRLELALSDASRPAVAQGLIWMLDQGLAADVPGFVAFHLAVPVQRGDTTIGLQGDMRFEVMSEERICSFQ